jgi:ClpP class serine protease
MTDPTIVKLLEEIHQSPKIRQQLIKKIESNSDFKNFRILLFFTSFRFPVSITDDDANIIEGILQKTDSNKELLLIINSPGGSALAAERIVRVCRSYSKNGFCTLVPKMAKSAATIITFGSKIIHMSPTSELGPIDPQVRVGDKLMSAYSIIDSYKSMLDTAVKTQGRIEPYLQQLARYDPREIRELELAQELSENIAASLLKSGMMKNNTEADIKSKLEIFLNPKETKVHGRAIYPEVAKKTGLNIEILDPQSIIWQICWELFIRADHAVNTSLAKLVETSSQHFAISVKT